MLGVRLLPRAKRSDFRVPEDAVVVEEERLDRQPGGV
jgi:hypothetical protein